MVCQICGGDEEGICNKCLEKGYLAFICPYCKKELTYVITEYSYYGEAEIKVEDGEISFEEGNSYTEDALRGYQCPYCNTPLDREEIMKGVMKWMKRLPTEKKSKVVSKLLLGVKWRKKSTS